MHIFSRLGRWLPTNISDMILKGNRDGTKTFTDLVTVSFLVEEKPHVLLNMFHCVIISLVLALMLVYALKNSSSL